MQAWLSALLISGLSCMVLATMAPLLRLVDRPDARKQHAGAIPVVGGLAIMLGFVLASRLAGIAGNFSVVAIPVGIVLAVGAWDDAFGMRSLLKLLAQVVAVWLLVHVTGWRFESLPLPAPVGVLQLGVLATPFTIVLGVGLLNAINTIDGLDGLSGGLLMIALLMLAAIAAVCGEMVLARIMLVLQAAVLGFFLLNARFPWQPRARVFLGDAGALGIGMLILWCMLYLGGGAAPRAPWPLLLAACWLPVVDLASVAVMRMRQGRSPLAADRRHFHHLLLASGFSDSAVALTGWILGATVAVVLLMMRRSGLMPGVLLLAQVLAAIVYAARFQRAWRAREQ